MYWLHNIIMCVFFNTISIFEDNRHRDTTSSDCWSSKTRDLEKKLLAFLTKQNKSGNFIESTSNVYTCTIKISLVLGKLYYRLWKCILQLINWHSSSYSRWRHAPLKSVCCVSVNTEEVVVVHVVHPYLFREQCLSSLLIIFLVIWSIKCQKLWKMFSNVFFFPRPKDVQFTFTEERKKQKIFTLTS